MTQDIEQLNKTFDQAFYNQSSPQRCEYCGTNMQANCHAHSKNAHITVVMNKIICQ